MELIDHAGSASLHDLLETRPEILVIDSEEIEITKCFPDPSPESEPSYRIDTLLPTGLFGIDQETGPMDRMSLLGSTRGGYFTRFAGPV